MIAGIDIGNSTTEVALWDPTGNPADGLLVAQCRTRGEKGSEQSLVAAADLLASVERRHQVRAVQIAVCELAPVRMHTVEPVAAHDSNSGVVRLDLGESSTPGGGGCGAGIHVSLSTLDHDAYSEPVVVSVPATADFELAAATIGSAQRRGWRIVGALVEADEGVLIANRLDQPIPVVDGAALELVAEGTRVIVEVAPPGGRNATLGDPLALATALGLGSEALGDLAPFSRALAGVRSAAVAVDSRVNGARLPGPTWAVQYVTPNGGRGRAELTDELDILRALAPGAARRLTGEGVDFDVSDVWAVHLPTIARELRMRTGAVRLDATLFATLSSGRAHDVAGALSGLTGRGVQVAGAEALAARRGALTTPNAPQDALVCDLGGGTIDVIGDGWHRVAAGAGEMLTSAVAYVLQLSRIAAEYVKRAPSMRMETELLALHESGERAFRDRPAPSAVVSWLCAEGPGRLLPFGRDLAPGEWRALRLALKEHVIGANIRRCLDMAAEAGAALLLCGGGAADDELVAAVTDGLHHTGVPVSRANVAGRCGSRYAVALGAAMSLVHE